MPDLEPDGNGVPFLALVQAELGLATRRVREHHPRLALRLGRGVGRQALLECRELLQRWLQDEAPPALLVELRSERRVRPTFHTPLHHRDFTVTSLLHHRYVTVT